MRQETVHVFVFDTLSDWEPGYAVAGINNPGGISSRRAILRTI